MRAERVGIALEIAQEKHGKSQSAIAREIGVSRQAPSNWKSDGLIDIDNVAPFCRACRVSIRWFMTGEGDPEGLDGLKDLSDEDLIAHLQQFPTARLLRLLHRATEGQEGSIQPE